MPTTAACPRILRASSLLYATKKCLEEKRLDHALYARVIAIAFNGSRK